jgi:hypothetical protein
MVFTTFATLFALFAEKIKIKVPAGFYEILTYSENPANNHLPEACSNFQV